MEQGGTYFNLDALKERAGAIYTGDEDGTEYPDRDPGLAWRTRAAYKGEEGFAVIDNMFVPLVPADPHWELGDHDKEEIWHFQLANNAIIVRAHPFAPRHATMPYSMAEAAPVTYRLWNPGSAEKLDAPQRMTDWLWNTRVQEIRLTLNKAGLDAPRARQHHGYHRPQPLRHRPGGRRRSADLIKSGQLSGPRLGVPGVQHPGQHQVAPRDDHGHDGLHEPAHGDQRAGVRDADLGRQDARRGAADVPVRLRPHRGRLSAHRGAGVRPLAERLASDMVQFLDGPIVAQMVGDEEYRRVFGEVDFLTVEPSQLSGAYRYQVSDGTLPPDPLRNADAAMKLMELGLQGAPVNLPVLLGLIARGLGLRNTSELIQLPPAAVAGPPAVMDQGTIDQQVQREHGSRGRRGAMSTARPHRPGDRQAQRRSGARADGVRVSVQARRRDAHSDHPDSAPVLRGYNPL